MPFKEHVENTLKFNPAPSPFSRMVLCSLCTTLPLVLGYGLNQLPLAIFGSLTGFALSLSDHFGPLNKRIHHLFVTSLFLTISLFVGAVLIGQEGFIALLLFVLAFLLGKSKDYGVELERVLLFSSLQLLAGAGTAGIKEHLHWILFYISIALLNYVICLVLIYLYSKNAPEFVASKRQTFKKIINQKETNRFAFLFATTATIGYLIANYFHISRGYWVVGTILLVMLPDSTQSLYKSVQRLLGTFVGVMIGALLMRFGHDPITLMIFCLIAAYFAPLGLIRNYWLGNIFIAALVLFLLEISKTAHISSFDLALLRTTDIALGCLLGSLGALINNPSILIHSKKKSPV